MNSASGFFRCVGSACSGRGHVLFPILLLCAAALGYTPQNAPPEAQPGGLLSPQQLDDLVAPIALYPDPLLAEVLPASTYPMEIAEAEQWVQDHPKWKPSKLMDEAKKQNWDPSVQGLVAFPRVLARLTQDMSWTTQLGNAFLAEQADVMQAVQRMRAQALAKGTLRSTPQETVTTETKTGSRRSASSPPTRMSGMCRITILYTCGGRRFGGFIRPCYTRASIWASVGFPA